MPFTPQALGFVEDVLADGFQYHQALDTFLIRSGIPAVRIKKARAIAEERSKASSHSYSRAPKRFVAQEIISELSHGTDPEERLLAGLVTAICNTSLKDAPSNAKIAQNSLLKLRDTERGEAKARKDEEHQRIRTKEREQERISLERAAKREGFRDYFMQLSQQGDPQARGYMLEKFLNEFLAFEGLDPRSSFKQVGEQIDGSFAWSGRTYLVEAKWVKDPVAGSGFSSLMYKIQGKTADTRGVFIAINGYSPEALRGLRMKGELRFVCLDGAHLMRSLEVGGSLSKLLEKVWRHANETGDAYIPVSAMTVK